MIQTKPSSAIVTISKSYKISLGFGLLFLFISFWTDNSVQIFLQPLRTEWGNRIMDGISYYGRGWSLTFLAALFFALGFLVRKKNWVDGGLLCLDALLISSLVVQLLKHLTGRPRPRLLEHTFTFHGPYLKAGMEGLDSFPSGHAVTTFAIAALLARDYPRARYFLYGTATLVSFSRIYLGAHYLSDVVAGALLGILCGRFVVLYAGRLLELAARATQERLVGTAFLVLTAILFFYQLGTLPLFDVDEAVFAESTREMLETGNFLTPTYNSTPRFDKPILFYWLMGSAFALLGVNELAARFWPALAGCGLVVITFLFGRAVAGFRCGLLCALILTTSLGILVLVRLAITDMVLTFFIAGSLYSFYLALHDYAGPRSASWASIGWAAAALAVLTKGPIGILFPAAIVSLFIWLSGHSQQWSYLRIRTGAAVLCLILLPWYVAEAYVTQGEFLRVFFVKHNILRYLAVNSDHSGPWFYYLVVILAGFLPWSAFLPASVSAGWKYRSQAAGSDREPNLPLFLLLWASVVLVFFSLAQTKLPNYVAPLFPALSLLVGWWCDRFLLCHPDRSARLSAIGGGLLSFIFAALFLLFYGFMDSLQSQVAFLRALSLSSDFGLIPLFLSLTSACVGSGFFLLLRPGKAPHGVAVIAVSMMVFAFGLYQSVMPRVSAHLQEPVRGIARAAAKRFEAETSLVVFGLNNPSILFYTKRPAILLGKNFSDLAEYLKQPRPMLVITNASLAEKLTGVHTVEQRGRYVLLSNRDHEGK